MTYQSKTTMVSISVGNWDEGHNVDLDQRFAVAHIVAALIASQCGMDIMSVAPFHVEGGRGETYTTVIYVNNGRTMKDICNMMKPFIEKKDNMWMLQDIYETNGYLDCVVAVRDYKKQWD